MQLNKKSFENLEISSLTSISPIDGRYFQKNQSLRPLLSEYGLIKHRLIVEIKWLQHLVRDKNIINNVNDTEVQDELNLILNNFNVEEAEKIVYAFLNTDFEGGRHERRVNKIACC